MELEEIKKFLWVDTSYEDDYINLLKEVAIEYIVDALGSFDETRAKQKFLLLTLIKDMYEKRTCVVDGKNENMKYIVRSIIMQEKLRG
ncbi:head-tail connector protein [uncultured Clostridium sp.]|uniref:head-tail connector protein n=1 Tax=uncultured Clostridium sp. TaxID=59620 RepID=UPI0025896120|nr:head-tail connector protein [uncultured Clostridium sp.]